MAQHDSSDPKSLSWRPPSVVAVVVLCVLVELVLIGADYRLYGTPLWRSLTYQYGAFWPGLLYDWTANYPAQPGVMFVSYAFLHAGPGHLAGNMITLVLLAVIVVERVGQRGFLAIYALSALGGAVCYAALVPGITPMVGASGAIFGLAGAWQYWSYIDVAPGRQRFWHLTRALGFLILLNIGLWFILDGALAWQTHLGGFVAGWGSASLLRRLMGRGSFETESN